MKVEQKGKSKHKDEQKKSIYEGQEKEKLAVKVKKKGKKTNYERW